MYTIHFLHFVTGQSLIAWMDGSITIVQITKTKAVQTMIMKSISSVIIVKLAYQKVNSFDILRLRNCLTNHVISDKTCDGIFHCLYGEDEHFELCKDTFPTEATIECVENRLPGTIDVTIMATPCDGILECRDGSDENCEEDKWILVIAVALLFLTTTCIYLYLVFVRLPIWKSSMFRDFEDGNIGSKSKPSECGGMKGNKLAKLKVTITRHNFPFRHTS